jgi:hypothetical protein
MSKYLKALYAAVFAGLGSTETAYVAGHGHIGFVAGVTIGLATLTALGVVFGVPNAAKE